MANVTFKAKAGKLLVDGVQVDTFKIPAITRNHCDMPAFRHHPTDKRLNSVANSDLFLGLVNGMIKQFYPSGYIRANKLQDNTTIQPGYLATVTINL